MTMHCSLRILEKIHARYCRRFLCSAAQIQNNAGNNSPAAESTSSPTEMTINRRPTGHVLSLFKEATKNGTESNATAILKEVMQNIRTNQVNVTRERAAKILQHEDCRYAFNVINKNLQRMSRRQAIDTLTLLKKLHVPQKSVIVQNTLAVLRASMNDMYINELVSLIKLLHNYNDTPLANALLSGLKLVFELKIRTEMDNRDLNEVTYVFQNLSLFGSPESMKAMTKLLYTRIENMTFQSAIRIHFGLCRMENFSYQEMKLFQIAKKTILTEIDLLSTAHVLEILGSVKSGIDIGNEFVYKPTFVRPLCEHMVSLKPLTNDLMKLTALMCELHHVNNDLTDYLGELWRLEKGESPGPISKKECILQSLNYFSDVNHRPTHWKNIVNALKRDILEQCTDSELLNCTLNLLALDCYVPWLVDKVLKMEMNSSLNDILVLDVYRIAKVLHPESSLEPNPSILETIRTKCESKPYIEQAKLEECLGGAEYVISALKTELGHIIDHTLLLSEYGNFMPFDNKSCPQEAKFVTDLKVPTNCHLVLLQTFPNHAYQVNMEKSLKGFWRVRAQCLQTLTHCPVLTINRKRIETLTRETLEMHLEKAVAKNKNYEFVMDYKEDRCIEEEEDR